MRITLLHPLCHCAQTCHGTGTGTCREDSGGEATGVTSPLLSTTRTGPPGRSVRFGGSKGGAAPDAASGDGDGLGSPASLGSGSRRAPGGGGAYSRLPTGTEPEGAGVGLSPEGGSGEAAASGGPGSTRKKRFRKPQTVEERQSLLGMKPVAGASKIKRGVKTAEMTLPSMSKLPKFALCSLATGIQVTIIIESCDSEVVESRFCFKLEHCESCLGVCALSRCRDF